MHIILYMQCPRSEEEGYVGEILLGIKWSQTTTDGDNRDNKLHGDVSDGQLQVYIVEGAGMVNEDSHKPFNAFIKWYVVETTHLAWSILSFFSIKIQSYTCILASVPGLPRYAIARFNFAGVEHFKSGKVWAQTSREVDVR